MTNPVTLSINALGLMPMAKACGVSYQAIRKWERIGRFPRTEWTGESDYIGRVVTAAAEKGQSITRDQLLVVSRNSLTTDQAKAA
jgi:hypothetical protein